MLVCREQFMWNSILFNGPYEIVGLIRSFYVDVTFGTHHLWFSLFDGQCEIIGRV